MANGPIPNGYDLDRARLRLSAAIATIERVQPTDARQERTKQALRDAARVLESHHTTMALLQQTATRLWSHLDQLGGRRIEEGKPAAGKTG